MTTTSTTKIFCCMCGGAATHHKRTLRSPGLFFCAKCRRDEIQAFGESARTRFTSLTLRNDR